MVWCDLNQKGGGCAVVFLLLVFLYQISRQENAVPIYTVLVLLGISRLLMIPAFGEIHRQCVAGGSARPSLSTVTTANRGSKARGSRMWSAAVGKSSCGRHSHLAGFFGLHDDVCAVIGEPHYNVYRYAASSRPRPSARSILYAPDPGGENIAQAPFSDSAAVPFAAT